MSAAAWRRAIMCGPPADLLRELSLATFGAKEPPAPMAWTPAVDSNHPEGHAAEGGAAVGATERGLHMQRAASTDADGRVLRATATAPAGSSATVSVSVAPDSPFASAIVAGDTSGASEPHRSSKHGAHQRHSQPDGLLEPRRSVGDVLKPAGRSVGAEHAAGRAGSFSSRVAMGLRAVAAGGGSFTRHLAAGLGLKGRGPGGAGGAGGDGEVEEVPAAPPAPEPLVPLAQLGGTFLGTFELKVGGWFPVPRPWCLLRGASG